MLVGFIVVVYLSGLDRAIARMFGGDGLARPAWMPEIEFPWRVFFGAWTTFAVAVCFRTPERVSAEQPVEAGEAVK